MKASGQGQVFPKERRTPEGLWGATIFAPNWEEFQNGITQFIKKTCREIRGNDLFDFWVRFHAAVETVIWQGETFIEIYCP